jgi:hypothetical protein
VAVSSSRIVDIAVEEVPAVNLRRATDYCKVEELAAKVVV